MKVVLIGNGVQSKRIQKILKRKKISFEIYKPKNKSSLDAEFYNRIKKFDIFFITSPNTTHFKYLHNLSEKYIFCEKPPVSKLEDLNKLRKMNTGKIYFNFNLRFSKIVEILQLSNKYNLGELIYGNIINSHGLAFKKEYKKNWRSNIKKNPLGIYETVQIHFIDLINFYFNIKKVEKPTLLNLSKSGTSFDTNHSKIYTKNDAVVDIFSTYKSCLSTKKYFLFQNGSLEQSNNSITIRGPAKNFDKKGFFKYPNLIKKFTISHKKDFDSSLEKSVTFFIKHCKTKKKFKKDLFLKSISTNNYLLNYK